MAKQKSMRKKVPLDGYIAPHDPANVLQNPATQVPLPPDPQVPVGPPTSTLGTVDPPPPGTQQPPPAVL
jgi:hypothetical protein